MQGPQVGATLSDLGADVVLSNFVPGTMEQWGLAENPRFNTLAGVLSTRSVRLEKLQLSLRQ